MEYNQIFELFDENLKGAFNAAPIYSNFDKYMLFRGEIYSREIYHFKHNIGKKLYDLANSGYAGLNLFSAKMIKILEDNNVTGWKTYPCILTNKKGDKIDDYYVFSVTGRCGPLDLSMSKKFLKQPYSPTGKPVDALKGLYFDINTWDKSDIFTPEGTMFSFVTRNLMEILVKEKVTNIKFEKITDIEVIK